MFVWLERADIERLGECCKLILAWWYVQVSDLPSSSLRACIRSSVCSAALTKMHSFMRCIHSHTALIHAIHHTYSCAVFIPAFHLLTYRTHSSAASCLVSVSSFIYQLRGLVSPGLFLLLSCITYTASYLLARVFSLSCIKWNIQLLVKEIRADGYKAPRLPHNYSLLIF